MEHVPYNAHQVVYIHDQLKFNIMSVIGDGKYKLYLDYYSYYVIIVLYVVQMSSLGISTRGDPTRKFLLVSDTSTELIGGKLLLQYF